MKYKFFIFFLTFSFYVINNSYSQIPINLNPIPSGGYRFNKHRQIDVISNIPDSNNLGYVPSDILNDRKYLQPSDSITLWLQSFIEKQFGYNANANKKQLLWVIQDLSAGKDSSLNGVYSFVKLKADIYNGDGQSNPSYQLTNTFDSTWFIYNGNADFGQMIAQSFIELYKNSYNSKRSAANNRFAQSNGGLTGNSSAIKNQVESINNRPILNLAQYKDGIYMSFDEFENNAPAITNFYADVNSNNNQVELYNIMPDSSSRLIDSAWGLSVNNELYYYASGQLYPIEKSGNTFYIAKYLQYTTRRNQAMYWRKYIGAKQPDNNPYNDAHVIRKNIATAKNVSLEATHLDFDSGDFIY